MVFASIKNFFRTIYLLVMDLYHFPEVRNMVKSVVLGWRQAGKRIKLTDSEGNSFSAVVVKGIHLPPFPLVESNINNYDKFHAREDDVWIVNWPKSGTHWVYEVVKLLMTDREELTDTVKEGTMFPEACAVESLEKLPSPRVLDTHVPLKLFPEEALKKSKIIYTLRNPKDAFVSGYYHMKNDRSLVGYEGSWNGFFELFINENTSVYGSWFDHVADWMEVLENNPNALVVKYEDMKRDLKKEVRRVAEFLGYPKSEEVYENVTKKCSFGHMKKAKKEPKSFWKPGGSMYRKGIVGDWKNHFTVAQNEKFNAIFNEKQNKLRVSVDFEL